MSSGYVVHRRGSSFSAASPHRRAARKSRRAFASAASPATARVLRCGRTVSDVRSAFSARG
ncbi:hypothetical protein HNR57_001838 [Streptomyces paradoxus]|uniref:Uncharacterized protein n=1 Tax=Streptomyces paradoxus TaxID=66375 RepID=A0A7W9WH33_9ACTN|nr:hypothetical protein [Streptomyces paradoxus]